MLPSYWSQATEELSARDPVMREIILSHTLITLSSRGNSFVTLARSIVGQQISVKASASVWRKLISALPHVTPTQVLAAPAPLLRGCGLSARKVDYLKDLAQHFEYGTLSPGRWGELDDESIIAELTQVKGIGRWTAEMFLIFNMLRPNVLPVDDIGLQRAIAIHYNNGESLPRTTIRRIGESWRPWCTVATWYLWRSLDPEPVEY